MENNYEVFTKNKLIQLLKEKDDALYEKNKNQHILEEELQNMRLENFRSNEIVKKMQENCNLEDKLDNFENNIIRAITAENKNSELLKRNNLLAKILVSTINIIANVGDNENEVD